MSEMIEIFLQGEMVPEIQIVKVPRHGTVRDLLKSARANNIILPEQGGSLAIFLEDSEEDIDLNISLEDAGIKHRSRLHCHRHKRIEVSINFMSETRTHQFSPSTTVAKVKRWADEKFRLNGPDATDHVLQLCGTNKRPDEDVHIGALVCHPSHCLCFDLVPKIRVEG
jgi:hypothetical protein